MQSQAGEFAGSLPRLLILVTGKGPQKQMYLERMRSLDLVNVAFRTLWLEPSEYPVLLGSCDAGVSLHYSSSGLDLPMKVRNRDSVNFSFPDMPFCCTGALSRLHDVYVYRDCFDPISEAFCVQLQVTDAVPMLRQHMQDLRAWTFV